VRAFSDLPPNMRSMPVDARGFPVPWFVPWVDGDPVFPAQGAGRAERAWARDLCWVCGGKLGRLSAYVIGPMCAVNRTSSEPPCHLECARFSARNCPFLANPRMRRSIPFCEAEGSVAGDGIERNPGVTLLWIVKTRSKGERFFAGNGYLFEIGKRHAHEWYAQGRQAGRDEVLTSINTGLPLLEECVAIDPDPIGAAAELERRKVAALELVPA
jgi:hypothetical protein